MTGSLLMLAIKCSGQASTLALQTRKQNEYAKQEKMSKSDFLSSSPDFTRYNFHRLQRKIYTKKKQLNGA